MFQFDGAILKPSAVDSVSGLELLAQCGCIFYPPPTFSSSFGNVQNCFVPFFPDYLLNAIRISQNKMLHLLPL